MVIKPALNAKISNSMQFLTKNILSHIQLISSHQFVSKTQPLFAAQAIANIAPAIHKGGRGFVVMGGGGFNGKQLENSFTLSLI